MFICLFKLLLHTSCHAIAIDSTLLILLQLFAFVLSSSVPAHVVAESDADSVTTFCFRSFICN